MVPGCYSASYRDLLGTAESIIVMDKEMHDVEAYMGELGRRCNTRILEKKGSNLRRWNEAVEAPSMQACSIDTYADGLLIGCGR